MRRRAQILVVAAIALAVGMGRPAGAQSPAPQSARELVAAAREAYGRKDFAASAEAFKAAVARGATDRSTLYDGACALALAGDVDSAFAFLRRAIDAGYRDPAWLGTDSDLTRLRTDARWAEVLAACKRAAARYVEEHSNPDRVRFVTSDIDLFWKVYDAALAAPEGERARIFERDYIGAGTVGLRDFNASGRADPATLADMLETRPAFLRSIRGTTESFAARRDEAVVAFRKLNTVYPEAIFPDCYFVVGQISSGGTASDNGLLMGAEMFTRGPNVPMGELGDWERGALMEPVDVVPLVSHELIHFQQKLGPHQTLLMACLKEGSADFLGELVSGRLIARMRTTHEWANAREGELWTEFQKEMDGKDISHWLYGSSGGPNRPVDLGYWMGYKIAEAYYRNAADKKKAVRDILTFADPNAFLAASRYHPTQNRER